jgi:hypothetical protein
VELHHLPSGQVLTWTHTGESLARHLRRAEEVAEECAAADERMRAPLPASDYDEVFPPKPSPGCGWCDYQRFCPEGQQAAAPHRPWDALAELLPNPKVKPHAGLGALGRFPLALLRKASGESPSRPRARGPVRGNELVRGLRLPAGLKRAFTARDRSFGLARAFAPRSRRLCIGFAWTKRGKLGHLLVPIQRRRLGLVWHPPAAGHSVWGHGRPPEMALDDHSPPKTSDTTRPT